MTFIVHCTGDRWLHPCNTTFARHIICGSTGSLSHFKCNLRDSLLQSDAHRAKDCPRATRKYARGATCARRITLWHRTTTAVQWPPCRALCSWQLYGKQVAAVQQQTTTTQTAPMRLLNLEFSLIGQCTHSALYTCCTLHSARCRTIGRQGAMCVVARINVSVRHVLACGQAAPGPLHWQ